MFETGDLFESVGIGSRFVSFRGASKLCLNTSKRHDDRFYSVKSREQPDYGKRRYLTQFVVMRNVTTNVSEKGRLKAIDSGVKNVHAHLIGQVALIGEAAERYIASVFPNLIGIGYDPFKTESFKWLNDGWQLPDSLEACQELETFVSAREVVFFKNGCAVSIK